MAVDFTTPDYQKVYDAHGTVLYAPSAITQYHKSREVAMSVQEKYANAGISRDVLQQIANKAIEMCNEQRDTKTLRTDMGTLWNNILARTRNPIDELCAVRMGAIACFLPNENPEQLTEEYTSIKVRMAEKDPDLYAFFLYMGVQLLPQYFLVLRTLNVQEYLDNRKQMLDLITV